MLRSPPKHEQEDIKTWNRDQTALREGGRTEAHVIEGSWAKEIRVSRRIQWTCKWVRFDEYDDGSDGLGLWRRMQLFVGCIQTTGGWSGSLHHKLFHGQETTSFCNSPLRSDEMRHEISGLATPQGCLVSQRERHLYGMEAHDRLSGHQSLWVSE